MFKNSGHGKLQLSKRRVENGRVTQSTTLHGKPDALSPVPSAHAWRSRREPCRCLPHPGALVSFKLSSLTFHPSSLVVRST